MSQFLKTRRETEAWLGKMKIKYYTINDDLSVDVDGDVDLSYKKLRAFRVRFGSIAGVFECSENKLPSLQGAPTTVGGFFECSRNLLVNLEGAPGFVGKNFNCNNNQLTSLQGAPYSVGGIFNCCDNPALGVLQEITDFASIKAILLKRDIENSLNNDREKKKALKI